MDLSDIALTVCMSTQVVNIIAVLIDYVLIRSGNHSITEVSTTYPAFGIAIIAFETITPISLGIHFLYYKKPEIIGNGNV